VAYEWIPSKWFKPGRIEQVGLIVVHTIECPLAVGMARKAALYCQTRPDPVSAHYYADPATVIQGVKETDTAYCAPGANANGIHIEQSGRAAFTTAEWHTRDAVAQHQIVAATIADISVRRNIALRYLDFAALRADPQPNGVTTHAQVALAYGKTDHTDPGPNYPLDYVLIEARALLSPQEDDMMPCVIPANAQPLPNGRFPYYTFAQASGAWSLRGGNGALIVTPGGPTVASITLPLAAGAKPLGLAEHGGFIVAIADDDATYAYVMG
jgi:hypothetical protein